MLAAGLVGHSVCLHGGAREHREFAYSCGSSGGRVSVQLEGG